MNTAICPVCDGTGRMDIPAHMREYCIKNGWYGYKADDGQCSCTNCGGQTMSGHAYGTVRRRPDGSPCVHEFVGHNVSQCLTIYRCTHCNESYQIDSGD